MKPELRPGNHRWRELHIGKETETDMSLVPLRSVRLMSSGHCCTLFYVLPLRSSFLSNQSSRFGLFVFNFYLLLVVLGLPCYAWAVSGCSTWGLLSRCSVWASSCDVFSCCRAQALGTQASVDTAGGLNSCGSWATDRGLSS